jgi:hypothetical protein
MLASLSAKICPSSVGLASSANARKDEPCHFDPSVSRNRWRKYITHRPSIQLRRLFYPHDSETANETSIRHMKHHIMNRAASAEARPRVAGLVSLNIRRSSRNTPLRTSPESRVTKLMAAK